MPNVVLVFDTDFQQNVVEITHPLTGEKKRYLVDLTPLRDVTVADLELLYTALCEEHKKIAFCRNTVKSNQIFKYAVKDEVLKRVQCSCCTFEESKVDIDSPSWKLRSNAVDEHSAYYLNISPRYSLFCEAQLKMVTFALVAEEGAQKLRAFTFDPSTEKFTKSTCECEECSNKIYDWLDARDCGAQGVRYARNHRDETGRPLICVAIEWYEKEEKTNGSMSTFCNVEGRIGRYRYNPEHKCFTPETPMIVRVAPKRYHEEIEKIKPAVMFDDQICFQYLQYCSQLKQHIFFGTINGNCEKFIFNSTYLQYDLVKCEDCVFDSNKDRAKKEIFAYRSNTIDRVIILTRKPDGEMEKMVKVDEEKRSQLGRAPVRYMKHLTPEEYQKYHAHDHTLVSGSYYLIGCIADLPLFSDYFLLSIGHVADMTGRIVSYENEWSCKRWRPVCKPIVLMDSDLIPLKVGYCEHTKHGVFSAMNRHNKCVGVYILHAHSNQVRQIHCCEADKDYEWPEGLSKGYMSSPNKGYSLVRSAEGTIQKRLSYGVITIPMPPMPVIQTFAWEEIPDDVYTELQRNEHCEGVPIDLINGLVALNANDPQGYHREEDDAESVATAREPSDDEADWEMMDALEE